MSEQNRVNQPDQIEELQPQATQASTEVGEQVGIEEAAGESAGFAAMGLGDALTAALAAAGIAAPTSVQAGVIPQLLAGRDGVLRSPTGSGKTLAYLLPLLALVDPAKRETQAVVIAPTQELAMQIVRVAEQYGEPLGLKTVALIGGAALSRQLDRMKGKPAIVVGTPGRIREVVSLRKLPLHAVRHIVVDETDRVFSLGGKGDVEFVLKGAAKDRQTVFVSATRSDTMRAAEARWLRDPWETTVQQEQEPGLPQTIEHLYVVSDPRDKIDLTRRLLRTMKPVSTLLFVNDIERIGELLAKLRYEGFAVDALYGDTPGRERGEVLRKFREGKTKLLIASDVAARGLDVPGLSLVLQFEPALDADHYVHRAGRTGRMGHSGISVTIVTPKEQFIMDKLAKQLRIEIRERRLVHGRLDGASGESGESGGAAGRGPRSSRDGGKRASHAHTQGQAGTKRTHGADASAHERGMAASGAKGPKRTLGGSPAGTAKSGAAGRAERHAPGGAAAQQSPDAQAGRSGGREAERPAASRAKDPGRTADKAGKAAKPGKAGKAIQAAPGAKTLKAAKAKENRERDRKNKGAPRWLKEKRANQGPENQ
ncbi:DEAD/DEAH box helicase [Cohnella sp. 56]|uniref:DEAD/DEAH box helicase n=1 Tax=Cohnella sp. 56 TaxID=3113722 RepID=UPI0030E90B89